MQQQGMSQHAADHWHSPMALTTPHDETGLTILHSASDCHEGHVACNQLGQAETEGVALAQAC